jgi:hypothetical protein
MPSNKDFNIKEIERMAISHPFLFISPDGRQENPLGARFVEEANVAIL